MNSEKFCLRWNDFETNISDAFRDLRNEKDFMDVTLVCEDEQIQAHKVILSACSSFFRYMLRRTSHQHPLVYLKGVKFMDLQAILNFMYHGEVSVAQGDLNSFLAVAEDLRVKGLTQKQSENKKPSQYKTSDISSSSESVPPRTNSFNGTPRIPVPKEPEKVQPKTYPVKKTVVPPSPHHDITVDDDIQELIPVKSEPHESGVLPTTMVPSHPSTNAVSMPDEPMNYQDEEYEDFDNYQDNPSSNYNAGTDLTTGQIFQDPSDLLQYVQKDPNDLKYHCVICNKFSHKTSYCVRNHVEAQHFPNTFVYECDQCDMTFSTKSSYSTHVARKHKKLDL